MLLRNTVRLRQLPHVGCRANLGGIHKLTKEHGGILPFVQWAYCDSHVIRCNLQRLASLSLAAIHKSGERQSQQPGPRVR